jgi:arylsulfatase A
MLPHLSHSTITPFQIFLAFVIAKTFRTAVCGLIVAILPLLGVIAFDSNVTAGEQPNIIVIMTDDLGYGDVSCYGAKSIETPNVDRLASEGLRFTNGYCSASTCTPTRYSLLTGTYAFRVKGTGVAPPSSPALIQPGTPTMPSLLKQVGYRTAVVGKWHLGLGGPSGPDWNGDLKPSPLEIGFDHSFILPTTNDRVPQVYVDDHRVRNLDPSDPLWIGSKRPSDGHPTGETHRHLLKMDWSHGHNQTIHNGISRIGFYTGGEKARFRDEDLADAWIAECNRWIESNRSNPFFLFYASHDIHVPRMVHERFQGKSKLGPRGDAILEMDWTIGEILKTLDRLELSKKTMIVFCSDNGPVLDDGYKDDAIEKLGDHRPNGPFRGGKYNIFEGGTRTPFIVVWPDRIQPGVSDEVVCTVDLAASFASLTGSKLSENACLDSRNVMAALLGEPNAKGRENLIQQDNGSGNFGYRVGNWKLQRHATGKATNVDLRLTNAIMPKIQLFDLSNDPQEMTDLSGKYPEIVKKLDAELSQFIEAGRSR